MTENEHSREVYAHFGLAVYLAQVLEHGIVNALVVLRLPDRPWFTPADFDAFMGEQFEKTLGTLIKALKAQVPVPPDLEATLGEALRVRNWLCHVYFRERAADFVTPTGKDKMLAELACAQELLQRADENLAALVRPIRDRQGVTPALLQAAYDTICRTHGIVPEPDFIARLSRTQPRGAARSDTN
jgi:hypothetical protein